MSIAQFFFLSAGEAEPPPPIPGAPTEVTTTDVTSNSVRVIWSGSSDNVVTREYRVLTMASSPSQVAFATRSAGNDAVLTGLDPVTEYVAEVRLGNASGFSDWTTSDPFETLPPGAPSPPTAPDELDAVEVSESQVDLSWTDNATDEDGYRIYRAEDGGAFSLLDTVATPDLEAYSDTTVQGGVAYCYRVRAYIDDPFEGIIESSDSNTACVGVGTPDVPANVDTEATDSDTVAVTWDPVTDADSYDVFVNSEQDQNVSGTSATVTGLDEGTEYDIQVRAVRGSLQSDLSDSESVTTFLAAATNFGGVLQVSGGQGFVRFTWTDNSALNQGYDLEFSIDGIPQPTLRAVGGSATQVDVPNGDAFPNGAGPIYEYWIVATHPTLPDSIPSNPEEGLVGPDG